MPNLIVGCGYLGSRVARRWLEAGEQVFATTRSAERAEQFRRQGMLPLVADVTRPESWANLPAVKTVLYAVGFDREAGKAMREVYVDGLRTVLDALPPCTERIIYISSTGVYGQNHGELVDEDSACQPERESGHVCLAAEQIMASHQFAARAIVLRLAGIYGPGRIPRREALMAGEPIAAESDGYLNLIHVDDAAPAVLAAEARATPPRTYLVSDGQPVLRCEYYRELARLVSAPPPRFKPPPPDSPRKLRSGSDKRICNARLVQELGVQFRYTSYREGLAAIVAATDHTENNVRNS